jgi:hypothetical protein
MTNTLRALAALCLVSLGLIASGCGTSSGSGGSNPASVIPESSFIYAEATIDPSGSQESAMRSILGDLPGTGAPQDRLENLIRDAIKKDRSTKVDWDKDIKPWLGDKIAGFVAGSGASLTSGNVPAAFVVATTDGDAAHDALEKSKEAGDAHKRYRDVEYLVSTKDGDMTSAGVVDGFLVVGDDAGMKAAIDASKDGRTLDKADKFKQATKDITDERVGFAYADLGSLIQLASQASGNQFPAGALFGRLLAGRPLVITARAENQALIFEGKSPSTVKSGSAAATLMQDLPQGSWAALALPDLGTTIRSFYTGLAGAFGGTDKLSQQVRDATGLDIEQDLLSWIGDVGLFVDGDSKDTLGGGLLIKSKNPAASKQALTKIAAAITKADPTTRVAAAHVPGAFGYELRSSDVPRSIFMLHHDDRVAFTYGDSESKDALSGGGLASSGDFKRAADGLGDGYSPLVYLSVPPILRVADAFGATSDKDYVKAKPYLTILDYLIVGTTGNGNDGRVRFGFKPHE